MPTWTSSEGARLHYRDVGRGLPVVLLHAFPLSGEMFEAQWTALSGRARFVVPDLRGFGHSPPGTGPAEMESLADEVLGLLDHLGVASAVVGGVSMGGYVSMALLRNDPGRVRALLLADTQMSPDDAATRDSREAIAQDVLANGTGVMVLRSAALLSPGATEAQRARMVSWILGNPPEGIANAERGMALRPDSRDILARFAGPLLVIVGALDGLTPPVKAQAMADLVRGSTLLEIPGAGHLSNVEQPEAFNAALERLLDRLAP